MRNYRTPKVSKRTGDTEEETFHAIGAFINSAGYHLENFVASDGTALVKLLTVFTVAAMIIMGTAWCIILNLGRHNQAPFTDWDTKIFETFQVRVFI